MSDMEYCALCSMEMDALTTKRLQKELYKITICTHCSEALCVTFLSMTKSLPGVENFINISNIRQWILNMGLYEVVCASINYTVYQFFVRKLYSIELGPEGWRPWALGIKKSLPYFTGETKKKMF